MKILEIISISESVAKLASSHKINHSNPFEKHFEKASILSFPGGTVVKNLPARAGDIGSIPGVERPPGTGNGSLFRYSCLENFMNGGAWPATVCGGRKMLDATEKLSMHMFWVQ